jgi:dTDP-4-dehydrorhamnose reductase
MRKILVLGKSGQLGEAISRHEGPWEYTYMGRDDLDLEKRDSIKEILVNREFDVLINSAAYTAVDEAEKDRDRAWMINAAAPEEMAEVCTEKNALLIHISTDYVFGKNSNRPLEENDQLDPINHYGATKLLGENSIRKTTKNHIIIRTSWLYGLSGKNFPKTMLSLAEKRKELKVVYDQIGNPTFADDLAVAIREIIEKYDPDRHPGTYHFSNEGVCSWYDFALSVFDFHGKKIEVEPVTSEAFPTKAERPPFSVLNKKKIKDTFGMKIRHWREALADFSENYSP